MRKQYNEVDRPKPRRVNKSRHDFGIKVINQIAKIVNAKVTDKKQAKNRLFLKFDNDIENEEMGTVTGPHIAGTGDDSSVVVVRKRKKKSAKDLYNYIKKRK